jgi:site-specific DNA-methyltransferase (adenine-specific)
MHEYIVMLEKGKRRLNNLGWGDILRHKRVQNRGHYPTEKPYALIEQLVLNSTKEGDLVFDPFCGSGVLGEVCKRHNRRALLLDKSDRAVTVSLSRIHDGLF